jgi:hypothetical protein
MAQIRRMFRCGWRTRVSCGVWWLGLRAAVVLLAVSAAYGQAATSVVVGSTPQDIETALHQMADRAGVIFVGQVMAVRRVDGGGVASGVVEIDFQVDQAIRGCTAGVPYALREWAGLWEGDARRYRVGQRLLMLLHAPGASGMSSPVDGMDGAIPIVRGGSGALAAGSSARMTPPAVDLRWVAVKMLHPVLYGSGAGSGGHGGEQRLLPQAVRAVAEGVEVAPVTTLSAGDRPSSASVASQEAAVDVVVGMLTSWQSVQRGEYAAR